MKFHYRCWECGKEQALLPTIMTCPDCGPKGEPGRPLRGVLDVVLQGSAGPDFHPHDLLPVARTFFPPIPVGDTPLWEPENLRNRLGMPNLYLKDDSANPTGSLKDRASFLVAAYACKHGIGEISLASTGNAASSMAGVGAAAGLSVTLFLPKGAPRAKMIQSLQYGARVIPVDGNYDKAYDLSLAWSAKMGGMNRNTAFNPLTIEGKKTVALEIFRRLGRAPDYLFVPTGDGVILSGAYKGFRDLEYLGLIEKVPVIYAVQAEGSNALIRAQASGRFGGGASTTVADSICVDFPRNGFHALQNLQRYQGRCVQVGDQSILAAQKELASSSGLFAEPAAAASFAGLLEVRNTLEKNAVIVLLVTGSGLKDPDAASRILSLPATPIHSLDELT